MQSQVTPKRTQFSSCDQCRKARVACDARQHGHTPTEPSDIVACTRCKGRHQRCTFEWMKDNKPISTHARQGSRRSSKYSIRAASPGQPARSTASPSSHAKSEDVESAQPSALSLPTPPSSADFIDPAISQQLHIIYEEGFEATFGSWMGPYGCPFGFRQRDGPDVAVSFSRLCRQLDTWMDNSDDKNGRAAELNWQMEQSLDLAIQAFAVRWLPVVVPTHSFDDLIKSLWRRARRDMLRVINRPSYQSMLALLLWASTPIPARLSEEEELDGISAQVCVQAALHQVQVLRARQRSLQFNGAKVSPTLLTRDFRPQGDAVTASTFLHAENTIFWAALTFDTSASLTLASRPVLSSGLFGIEYETSWRLVRSCRKIFVEEMKEWHETDCELTDLKANQIIAACSNWKLLIWKMTAILKEALVDGHDEQEVLRALTAVVRAFDDFNSTYRDLVAVCEKRIQFFSQITKLRWYVLVMHLYLTVLLAVDVIEATGRTDLLRQFSPSRTDAESCVLNSLAFGLSNTFTVPVPEGMGASEGATVSLIAIDPYPHHVVAGVKLLRKAIDRDYSQGKIDTGVRDNLAGTLMRVLQDLPDSSKSVQAAKNDAERQPT